MNNDTVAQSNCFNLFGRTKKDDKTGIVINCQYNGHGKVGSKNTDDAVHSSKQR